MRLQLQNACSYLDGHNYMGTKFRFPFFRLSSTLLSSTKSPIPLQTVSIL